MTDTALATREEPDEALVAFSAVGIGIETAQIIANRLDDIIKQKKLFTKIGPKNHINIEAWCACAGMCGLSPRTEWSRRITDQSGTVVGYESRVEVVRISTNEVVGAAEAECWLDEKTGSRVRWNDRFAAKGMSQTRATSRAIAQILRWIPVLAGYEGTPAEELSEGGPPPVDNPTQRDGAARAQPRGRRVTSTEVGGLVGAWKAVTHPIDATPENWAAYVLKHAEKRFNVKDAAEWSEMDYTRVKAALENGL